MTRRLILIMAGVGLLALSIGTRPGRHRAGPGRASWQQVSQGLQPRWLPAGPRPRVPDDWYSNGLTHTERRAALRRPCACSDPHPWEFLHADPIPQRQARRATAR